MAIAPTKSIHRALSAGLTAALNIPTSILVPLVPVKQSVSPRMKKRGRGFMRQNSQNFNWIMRRHRESVTPHHGDAECARRRRQLAAKQISPSYRFTRDGEGNPVWTALA